MSFKCSNVSTSSIHHQGAVLRPARVHTSLYFPVRKRTNLGRAVCWTALTTSSPWASPPQQIALWESTVCMWPCWHPLASGGLGETQTLTSMCCSIPGQKVGHFISFYCSLYLVFFFHTKNFCHKILDEMSLNIKKQMHTVCPAYRSCVQYQDPNAEKKIKNHYSKTCFYIYSTCIKLKYFN